MAKSYKILFNFIGLEESDTKELCGWCTLATTSGSCRRGYHLNTGAHIQTVYVSDAQLFTALHHLNCLEEYKFTISTKKYNDKWYTDIWHIEDSEGNLIYDYRASHPKSEGSEK